MKTPPRLFHDMAASSALVYGNAKPSPMEAPQKVHTTFHVDGSVFLSSESVGISPQNGQSNNFGNFMFPPFRERKTTLRSLGEAPLL